MKTTILTTAMFFIFGATFGQGFIADGSKPERSEGIKDATTVAAPPKASLDTFGPAEVLDTTRNLDESVARLKNENFNNQAGTLNDDAAVVKAADAGNALATDQEAATAMEEKVAEAVAAASAAAPVSRVSVVRTNMKASDYKAEVKSYTEVLKADPKAADAFMARASAYIGLKDYKDAIRDYNAALELNPELVDAYYNRGMAKMHIGNFQAGINDMTKVIRLRPGDVDAYFHRAMCKMYLDQITNAITDFTVVVKMDPSYNEAYFHRAILKFDNEDWHGACADWSKIAATDERAAKAITKYCEKK